MSQNTSTAPPPPSVAILGAGITGLVAAHRLAQRGLRVRLYERATRPGGVIASTRNPDGWLVEHGPNSLLDSAPHGAALRALIAELGLGAQVTPASPEAKNRYLVKDGRLIATPRSARGALATPLLSARGKWRLIAEAFRPKPREPLRHDLSLADFAAQHFGHEVVDALLDPFVSGVYAGDPQKLSARHAFPSLWAGEQSHGSLLRAQVARMREMRRCGAPRTRLFSFKNGLQTLTDALARSLPAGSLELGATVRALMPPADAGGAWRIRYASSDDANAAQHTSDANTAQCGAAQGLHEEPASSVICALPAHALAELQIDDLRPLHGLSAVEHPPLSALFLGYRREQVAHPLDGFGLLVPAREALPLLGVIFASTLFPGRAHAGHVALHVMIGGARQAELAALCTEELLARVQPALGKLLGTRGAPVFVQRQHWPRAIPQYNLGYEAHLAALASCEARYPGLFIGGQCRDGISTPACISSGERLAASVLA